MKLYIRVKLISLESYQQAFKIRPFNLKSRLRRSSIKRTPPKRHLSHLWLQEKQQISAKAAIFIAAKREKTILAVIEICLIIFLFLYS